MDLADVRRFLETQDRAWRALVDAEETASRRRDAFERVSRLITGLRATWHDEDPGKYEPHVFLVRDFAVSSAMHGLPRIAWAEAFHAKELRDDGGATMACPCPSGSLGEAKRLHCPGCGSAVPVVGTYEQAGDSPQGDVWEMKLFTLCLRCIRVDGIAEAKSPYRMSLSAPDPR